MLDAPLAPGYHDRFELDDALTTIFWNVAAKDLAPVVGRLARAERADLVVLAEVAESDETVQRALCDATGGRFHRLGAEGTSIRVFSTYPMCPLAGGTRFAGCKLTLGRGREIGVFGLHLPSKLHRDADDQQMAASQARQAFEAFEAKLGHRRTLMIGDFNMDPFERGMVSALGFHAVLDRSIAARQERTVQGARHRLLYNPMWSRMGDASIGPPGSYFYGRGGATTQFWHTFDQVLVRSELVEALVVNRVRVVARIGRTSLIEGGKPNAARFSDHLPLRVELKKSEVTA